MLLHDRFVFIEVRKTACTFLAHALEEELPAGSFQTLGKHRGWRGIPPEAGDRPVLAYIRNPWDWYVSWYHYCKAERDPLYAQLSQGDTLDFRSTVANACSLFSEHMGCDVYSFLFRMSVGSGLDSNRLTVGRYESLFDDLEGFLAEVGDPLVAGAYRRIRSMDRLNASDHGPYRSYYDDELRELVRRSSAPLIERFGYEF